MKQTATNYLIDQLSLKAMAEHMPWVAKILDTAIEMEKNQIVEAYNTSFLLRHEPYSTAEKYYNETYESNT
jgi:hypothetical protein